MIEAEGEQTVVMVLRVHSYGRPEKVQEDVKNTVVRALTQKLGKFEVLTGGQLDEVRNGRGNGGNGRGKSHDREQSSDNL